MATTVTVGSGLDYASMNAAITGLETGGAHEHDFASDGIAKVSIEDSFEDLAVVDIWHPNFTGGSSSNMTNYLLIETNAANRTHKEDNTQYYMGADPGSMSAQIEIEFPYTHLKWVQCIQHDDSGSSDENIRIAADSDHTLIEKCCLKIENTGSQDCIYSGNWALDEVSVYDCVLYRPGTGPRTCLHAQVYSGSDTQTWRVEHCSLNCKDADSSNEGGLACVPSSGATVNMHAWNNLVWGVNTAFSAENFKDDGAGTVNWTGQGNVSSDDTCIINLGSTNNQDDAVVDADNDSGTDVQITTVDLDYQLVDGADNGWALANAVDGATRDSRIDTTVDIAGNARPTYASGLRDTGAFQITAAAGGDTVEVTFTGSGGVAATRLVARYRALTHSGSASTAFSRLASLTRSLTYTGAGAAAKSDIIGYKKAYTFTGSGTSSTVGKVLGQAVGLIFGGAGAVALSKLTARFLSLSFGGSAAVNRQRDIAMEKTISATGTPTVSPLTARQRAYSFTGTAAVAFAKILVTLWSEAFTGAASVAFSKLTARLRSFSMGGTAAVTRQRGIALEKTTSATGSVSSAQTTGEEFEGTFTGTGSSSMSKTSGLSQVLNAVGSAAVAIGKGISKSFSYVGRAAVTLVGDGIEPEGGRGVLRLMIRTITRDKTRDK